MSDRVSVVLTTFNRPERLEHALHSIALQRGVELKVIVVNDGGVDVGDTVARWGERMSVQHVHLPVNGGLARARNEGIRRANGNVLTFLDDDDVMLADHLQTGVEALSESGQDAV